MTISNAAGQTAVSSVTVDVSQYATTIRIDAPSPTLNESGAEQLIATEYDQFGNAMATPPTFTWSVGDVGFSSIDSGFYTAPSSAGYDLVTVSASSLTATASIEVVATPIAVAGGTEAAANLPYMLYLESAPLGTAITSWTINWDDDGGTDDQTVSSPLPSAVPHVYTTAGLFTITATASNGSTFYTTINADSSKDPGTPDTTFATQFGDAGLTDAGFNTLATLPNGDIVAGGATSGGAATLGLFTSAGADTGDTFDSSGMSQIRAVAVQPNASGYDIIAAGIETSSGDYALIRYYLDGTEWKVDSTFAGGDAIASPFGEGNSFRPDELAIGSEGSIVVGGYVTADGSTDFGLACYSADGTLNMNFGSVGGATTGGQIDAYGNNPAAGMTIDSQGNIVLAGTANIAGVTDGYEFALARFTSDGVLDSSFGDGGTVVYDLGDQASHATSVAIQSDGGIIAGGWDGDGDGNWDVVRFLSGGSVDTNFGDEGKVELSQGGIISSVAVQPNNQIFLGGTSGGYPSVARLNVDGSLDSTFGSDGIVTDESSAGWLDDLLVQSNGSILVAGGEGGDPLLARYYAGDVAGTQVNVTSGSPALKVSGSSTAIAGNTYTLSLGDGMTDLGSGSDVGYDIVWGDDSPDTIVSADALAAQQNQVSHVFNAATSGITVNLEVDGSAYSDVSGSALAVAVDMTDATTTSLTVSLTSPTFGQTVTLTATVSATSGAASGTVEFYDGTMDLGSGTLLVTGGYDVASLVTPPLALGDHAFSAVYGGDGTFSPSNSAVTVKAVTSGMLGTLSLTGSATATRGSAKHDLRPDPAGQPRFPADPTIYPVVDKLGRRRAATLLERVRLR